MSISSSLNAGVMGLNSNSSRLSAISDNIANSSTYGYKRSQVDFSSMVLQQQSSAYAAGGVRVTSGLRAGSSCLVGLRTPTVKSAMSAATVVPTLSLSTLRHPSILPPQHRASNSASTFRPMLLQLVERVRATLCR